MSNLVIDNKENVLAIEYFKTLRTNIQFYLEETEDNSFLVTSSQPGEGKSFVTTNIASMFAIAGYKTIVVDLDLRRRTQHIKLGVKNKEGMVNILTNKEFENESYIEENLSKYINQTKVVNLDVITAGDHSITPPELLIKPRFNKIVEYLKTKYDYVILDTPPINIVADTNIIAKDRQAIVVSSMNETKLPMLKQTVTTLEKVNAKVIGTVLNKVPINKNGHYGNNRYGYEYTYTYSTALATVPENNKIAIFNKKNMQRMLELVTTITTLPIALVLFLILMITSKAKKMDKVFEKDTIITKKGETKSSFKFCTTTTVQKKNSKKQVVNDYGKLLENTRLEYLPHIFNYISGDLSFKKDNASDADDENNVINL